MTISDIRISPDLLQRFMVDVFTGIGLPRADAETCAEVLITADLRGIDSHGIGRLKRIYFDRIREGIVSPVTEMEVVKDTPTTAVIDGRNGMGHVIGKKAMETAIEKAARSGLGMVACRNSSHYGIAGYYALMAVEKDMIGITGTNARPSIAPTFGVENMLGTNPLTFGIPTDEEFPFVLDCATSITQRGKIEVYEREGKEIPPGWVIDGEGQTRTDTARVLKDLVSGGAALTPLGGPGEVQGGHKGYGYAGVVEILSAALSGGNFLKALSGYRDGEKVPYLLGHFFIAVNPEFFMGVEIFKRIAGAIARDLRNSKKIPGAERIYTAGEKEYLAEQERRETGIPIPAKLRQEMIEMRDRLNLDYRFPFEA